MHDILRTLGAIAIVLAVVAGGCSNEAGTDETHDSDGVAARRGEHDGEHGREGRGEHDRDGAGHDGAEGEESGTEYALNETYDSVRNGARLILAYDAPSNSFLGTVENTTNETLQRVRVEVHLSNGKELGPTTPADLGPGQKRAIKLTATSADFDAWSAHPEVGNSEHGSEEHGGGEEAGEHGGEARGEHSGREGRGEHD